MTAAIVFWTFQVLNGLTSLGLVINPRKFHEGMFKEPERVYEALGFSATAREMLHNVLRGQGTALLTITVFLFYLGADDPNSLLLIAITCFTALGTHLLTLRHHRTNKLVKEALGDSLKSIYPLILINLLVGGAALALFLMK